MTEDEMVEAAIRAGEEAPTTTLSSSSSRPKRSLPTYAASSMLRQRLRRPPRTRQRTPPSVPPVCRPTGRTSVAAPPASVSPSASARPRSLSPRCCRWLTISSVQSTMPVARSFPTTLSSSSMALMRCMPSCSMCLRTRALSHRPKGEAFDPLEHQAVGRVEDASQYDETVNDVYQKGYRMADRILRSAMVTVPTVARSAPHRSPKRRPRMLRPIRLRAPRSN